MLNDSITGVEVLERFRPWTHWLLAGAVVIVSAASSFAVPDAGDPLALLVLNGWNSSGLFGCALLHASIEHLAANLLLLLVFGQAICGTVGNRVYVPLCLGFQLAAAGTHLLFGGGPAVGASGMVSGLIGMTAALFPLNRSGFHWLGINTDDGNAIPVWLLCLVGTAIDLAGALLIRGNTAWVAHLGGTFAGVAAGLVFLHQRWIILTVPDNRSLYEMITGTELEREEVDVEASVD